MLIREAILDDAESLGKVIVDSSRSTYAGIVSQGHLDSLSYDQAAARWRERLGDERKLGARYFTYVAEDNCNVFGFARGGPSEEYGLPFSGELGTIYLLESHQRQGAGRKLAATVGSRLNREGYSSMVVWVLTENPYRAFYEALGGRVVAERFVDRWRGHYAATAYGWDNLEVFNAILKLDSII